MQRFILQENARGFRARLAETADDTERSRLIALIAETDRELAQLDATESGAGGRPMRIGGEADLAEARAAYVREFRAEFGDAPRIAYLIDPRPGLKFVDVNAAFAAATGLGPEEVVGQPLFQLFPDNPGDTAAHGIADVYASMRLVAEKGHPNAMPVIRYDVRDARGAYVERWWRQVNSPLHDEDGRLIFLLAVVEEVTDEILRERPESTAA